jgi:hypothetical protein
MESVARLASEMQKYCQGLRTYLGELAKIMPSVAPQPTIVPSKPYHMSSNPANRQLGVSPSTKLSIGSNSGMSHGRPSNHANRQLSVSPSSKLSIVPGSNAAPAPVGRKDDETSALISQIQSLVNNIMGYMDQFHTSYSDMIGRLKLVNNENDKEAMYYISNAINFLENLYKSFNSEELSKIASGLINSKNLVNKDKLSFINNCMKYSMRGYLLQLPKVISILQRISDNYYSNFLDRDQLQSLKTNIASLMTIGTGIYESLFYWMQQLLPRINSILANNTNDAQSN